MHYRYEQNLNVLHTETRHIETAVKINKKPGEIMGYHQWMENCDGGFPDYSEKKFTTFSSRL